ncbi:MAG: DUF1559 domain-containing protein [Planctomycetaceae bacterium]
MTHLGSALKQYVATWHALPTQVVRDNDGRPLLSWRVLLLPHVGETDLHDELHLSEPWDSEHNAAILARRPPIFGSDHLLGPDAGRTRIVAITGASTLFPDDDEVSQLELVQVLATTPLLVTLPHELAVPWTAPADWSIGTPIPKADGDSTRTPMVLEWSGKVRPLRPDDLAVPRQPAVAAPVESDPPDDNANEIE